MDLQCNVSLYMLGMQLQSLRSKIQLDPKLLRFAADESCFLESHMGHCNAPKTPTHSIGIDLEGRESSSPSRRALSGVCGTNEKVSQLSSRSCRDIARCTGSPRTRKSSSLDLRMFHFDSWSCGTM